MSHKNRRYFRYVCYSLILLLASCGGKQTLRGVFNKKQTPYEKYASRLKDANLTETALGQEWIQAGQQALQDSITVTLPFKETGYFAADKPKALGYRLDAKRGERITVNLEVKAREQMQVFLDMFEAPETASGQPRHVASADTAATMLSYEVEEDQQHLVRIQPELLRSGQYTVTIQAEPSLAFPVLGKSSRNIASIWGDARDGGARRHEGIDVFAKRGTPALAATAGMVTRVDTTPRGGKVVWLTDYKHRQSLYYAHLDSQLVAPGQRVEVGDTLGLVGNTGNAITTGPHLHFGIYRFGRGATNPYPYVHLSDKPVPAVKVDTALAGSWIRVRAKAGNARFQPSTKSAIYQTLPQHTPLQVVGGTANWFRASLPNGREVYIASSIVEPTVPLKYEKLPAAADLLDEAHPLAAAKANLPAGSSVALLGHYQGFDLVQDAAGETGWIKEADVASAQ